MTFYLIFIIWCFEHQANIQCHVPFQ